MLLAGITAFVAVVAGWIVYWALTQPHGAMFPVDLTVYRDGGLIVRGVRPYYDPAAASPLYDWGGYTDLALKFTYTPFAAISFALLSFIPLSPLIALSVVVNMAALVLALWFTIGGLGYVDGRLRAGLAGGADVRLRAALTLFRGRDAVDAAGAAHHLLGQINLVLMALIIWDLCQPRERRDGKIRWWPGFGHRHRRHQLVPLVFVPYLLVTRRFREAAMTLAGFVVTVAIGFAVLPADSSAWWLHGVFLKGGRTGFIGWAGNQSLRAIITRFAGSVNAGTVPWAIAAVIVLILGIAAAALLSRAGHEMPALLMTALTGLLISPISWDHHWVWIAPGFATAVSTPAAGWAPARRRAGSSSGSRPASSWSSARGRTPCGRAPQPRQLLPRLPVGPAEHQPDPLHRARRPARLVKYRWHGLCAHRQRLRPGRDRACSWRCAAWRFPCGGPGRMAVRALADPTRT